LRYNLARMTDASKRRALAPAWARLVIAVGAAIVGGQMAIRSPASDVLLSLAAFACAAAASLALDLDLSRPRIVQALVTGAAFGVAMLSSERGNSVAPLFFAFAAAGALAGALRARLRRQRLFLLRGVAGGVFGGAALVGMVGAMRELWSIGPRGPIIGAILGITAAISLAVSGWRDFEPFD
jgi:hypothetical protein